ncbi:hypothetical protein QAD02_006792 [Eretmocerus hayati]|uniref:Uncharacterized protein n=1 Tax=Eretmocerus hayati TaxID=131215 RepID=A0ACC2N658_9HYME|nr:hypothetical protein QAD02_006792 [Eretmocerus hayati]
MVNYSMEFILFHSILAGYNRLESSSGNPEILCYDGLDHITTDECNLRCKNLLCGISPVDKGGTCQGNDCICYWSQYFEFAGKNLMISKKIERVDEGKKKLMERRGNKMSNELKDLGYARFRLGESLEDNSCDRSKSELMPEDLEIPSCSYEARKSSASE